MYKSELGILARRFGADIDRSKLLHQNFRHRVYEYDLEGRKLILKISSGQQSYIDLLKGELDWINYLYDNGVRVSRPIRSVNGHLIEAIEIDDLLHLAHGFEKLVDNRENGHWNADLIQKLGEVMGRIHALTKDYRPSDGVIKRPEWSKKDWLARPDKVLHPSHDIVIKKCHELREKLSVFDTNRDSYGLIHDDLHSGNIIIFNNEITVIDFECCHYTWLVSDIASALLFDLWKTQDSDMVYLQQSAANFMKNLLAGYGKENCIDKYWLQQIPLFLKLREMSLYVSSGFESRNVKDIPLNKELFFYWKYNIENDVPYIDIDFSNF